MFINYIFVLDFLVGFGIIKVIENILVLGNLLFNKEIYCKFIVII